MNEYDDKTTEELLHEALRYVRYARKVSSICLYVQEQGNEHDEHTVVEMFADDRVLIDSNRLVAAICRRVITKQT